MGGAESAEEWDQGHFEIYGVGGDGRLKGVG